MSFELLEIGDELGTCLGLCADCTSNPGAHRRCSTGADLRLRELDERVIKADRDPTHTWSLQEYARTRNPPGRITNELTALESRLQLATAKLELHDESQQPVQR